MRCKFAQIAIVLLLVGGCGFASQVVDRIIATVNGKPVLQSELEDEIRFEALQEARPPTVVTAAERNAAFQRLIERQLLLQQMQDLYMPTAAEIARREEDIRVLYPSAKSNAAWESVLASYGFTQKELDDLISSQLQTLRFVEMRLRPTVRVQRSEIVAYYNDKLVPQVKRMGAEPDPLSAVADKIEELLTQQKIDKMFSTWMQNLRSQSEIHIMDPELKGAATDTKAPSGAGGNEAPSH